MARTASGRRRGRWAAFDPRGARCPGNRRLPDAHHDARTRAIARAGRASSPPGPSPLNLNAPFVRRRVSGGRRGPARQPKALSVSVSRSRDSPRSQISRGDSRVPQDAGGTSPKRPIHTKLENVPSYPCHSVSLTPSHRTSRIRTVMMYHTSARSHQFDQYEDTKGTTIPPMN